MPAPFAAALGRVLADLRLACAVEVVWKDADPSWWARLPPALSQHRNPHCLAVKADRLRLARCIGVDALEDGDFAPGQAFRLRTCPFGVAELLVPVRLGGIYHGCALVGPWRGAAAPACAATHAALPPLPPRARLAALARTVAAALAPLAAGRTAAQAAETAGADPLMAGARAWIERHLAASLRVRRVAAETGLSPSRFVHRFAAACGTPFGPYLRRRLMEEAARRLAAGDEPVGAVAAALGFASQSRFGEAFRRHHRCTPGAFRARLGA